jgi:sorbitol-specific phosphotransferase system component IIC
MQGGVIGPARLAALFLTCVEPSLILAVAQLDLSKAMGEERMNRSMTSMEVACILLYAVTPASAQENDPGAWR